MPQALIYLVLNIYLCMKIAKRLLIIIFFFILNIIEGFQFNEYFALYEFVLCTYHFRPICFAQITFFLNIFYYYILLISSK